MVKRPTKPKPRCYTLWFIVNNNRLHVSGCFCFSHINISQGSVAMRLSCGGMFYYCFTKNSLLSLPVKELWKSVSIWQSYRKQHSGTFFRTSVIQIQKQIQIYIAPNSLIKRDRGAVYCYITKNKSSAVTEMGDRLATIDMDRKVGGCCAPFRGGSGSPCNTVSPGPGPSGILIHPTVWT